MNLRGMANPATQTVNANIDVVWVQNTGYTTNDAGKRTPTTSTLTLKGNVQALDAGDLRHTDSINLQGVTRAVYLYGNIQGIVRADGKGGDILQFPQVPGSTNQNWLVYHVSETWPDWCKVLVVLQQ